MSVRTSFAVVLVGAMLLPAEVLAVPQCFQPFSGVVVMFNPPVTTTGTAALNGRVWGAWRPALDSHHGRSLEVRIRPAA